MIRQSSLVCVECLCCVEPYSCAVSCWSVSSHGSGLCPSLVQVCVVCCVWSVCWCRPGLVCAACWRRVVRLPNRIVLCRVVSSRVTNWSNRITNGVVSCRVESYVCYDIMSYECYDLVLCRVECRPVWSVSCIRVWSVSYTSVSSRIQVGWLGCRVVYSIRTDWFGLASSRVEGWSIRLVSCRSDRIGLVESCRVLDRFGIRAERYAERLRIATRIAFTK